MPRGGKHVALTFDDGPSNETPRFVETLGTLGVRATFFFCGLNVERRPEVARDVVSAGHAVGNHTHSHPRLPFCSFSNVRQELLTAQRAITRATGVRPELFRPPYGLRSPALRTVLPECNLLGVHWSVIGNDWKCNASEIVRRVLAGAGDGAIICLHDGDRVNRHADRGETLRAVRRIVPELQDRGFRFVAPAAGARRPDRSTE